MRLGDGLDMLMRPAIEGLYRMESLLDGTLTLVDVALANESLDVKAINERRARDAAKR